LIALTHRASETTGNKNVNHQGTPRNAQPPPSHSANTEAEIPRIFTAPPSSVKSADRQSPLFRMDKPPVP
jgi:hypothetical protein